MSNNSSKLWVQKRGNQAAINRAQEAILSTGRALPCRVVAVRGAVVTVAFEVDSTPWVLPQITIPKAESNWIRMPTQVGDTGMTMPADAYLGIVSGLGSGLPSIQVQPSNLSALVFVPVSSNNSPPSDQNAAIAQGPNGAVMQTTSGTPSSAVTNTSGTTITFGSNTIVLNATGFIVTIGSNTFEINSSGITMSGGGQSLSMGVGGLILNGINFNTHVHGGVTTGGGDTTGPL
jgi:hypothetical protein